MPPSFRRLHAIAQGRAGVFTHDDARRSGFTDRMIRRHIDDGRFVVLHPGIFSLAGTIMSWRTHLWAACLWSRDGLVSHRAAAALYGLSGFREEGRPEITVTTCHLPPRAGIIVHATDLLPDSQRGHRSGFPVVSIERTLLDLGAVCSERRAAIALDNALLRGLTSTDRLDECLRVTAKKGRRGCGVLRRLTKRRVGLPNVPNSPAETVLFDLLSTSSLPRPQLQYEVDLPGGTVARPDFAWPDRRFAVEMDGFEFHWGRDAFERDRERLNKLMLVGWRVLFATWREATGDPGGLLMRIEDGYEAAGRSP